MAEKHWNQMTEAERAAEDARLDAEHDRIAAMSDEQLHALVDPVKDLSPAEWSEEQLRADSELHDREREEFGGFVPETNAQVWAHPGTVQISVRMPEDLLERLRAEAERRGTRYQTLMKELIEDGLRRPAGHVARVSVDEDLVRELERGGSLTLELSRRK